MHWWYELVENDLLKFTFYTYKNDLLFFNRQELLQNAKDRYHNCDGKEKTTEYYIENNEVLEENAKSMYKKLPKEEKEVKREYERNRYIETW